MKPFAGVNLVFGVFSLFGIGSNATLQEGAPFPMRGRNGLHLSISPFIGPNATYASIVSTYTTSGKISSSPIIDRQGNILFGSENSLFYKLAYDLSFVSSYTTTGLIQSTAAIDNTGNIYFSVQTVF